MSVTAASATWNPATGELHIEFSGPLTPSTDISPRGFSAVLPSGKRAVFNQAGMASNEGEVGELTFVVEEGAVKSGEPTVRYQPAQAPLRLASRGGMQVHGGSVLLGCASGYGKGGR